MTAATAGPAFLAVLGFSVMGFSVGGFSAGAHAAPADTPVGSPVVAAAEARPRGFIEMFVAGVVPTPDGHTLVLVNAEEEVLLPLGIGLNEALSIHTRLERRADPEPSKRPMTHDLLDHILTELGGEVVRVQIDDVRDDLFVGTIYIRKAGKVFPFDARPSDAVALAIGSRAPIYVARPVVDKAALHPEDLVKDAPPSEPMKPAGLLSL